MKPRHTIHFLLLALLSVPALARAQGTAFTYNGRLNNNGTPVTGLYDLRVTLYDANAVGNVVAGPLPIIPVGITNGLFTVALDFGAGVFTGPARWLNIEVRPTGGGSFATLAPRQEVTSSPYSIRAQTAGTASSVANSSVTAGQLNTGGAPTPGQVLSYNGGNLSWSDPASTIWSQLGTNAYYNGGNVGIGSAAPVGKLEVVGQDAVRLIGFNPFLTLYDSNAGYARSRIQGVGGDVDLFTESYLNGSIPSAFLKLANNGNVGIGSTAPVGKLDVVGQDAIRLIGFNPFLTLYDSNAGYARSRIQGVGGDVDLFTESYLSGANTSAFLKLANNGNVGIGITSPLAKLDLATTTASVTGVKARTTSGTALYGHSDTANGVVGESSTGVGVYGIGSLGQAIYAEGNAGQSRDKGGFVKAMALVHVERTGTLGNYVFTATVTRCFNGIANTSSSGCSFTVSANLTGTTVDFGFPISDRFISVTGIGDTAAIYNFPTSTSVVIQYSAYLTDFFIFVY